MALSAAWGESPLYSFARGFFYLVQGRAGLLAGNHAAIIEGFETTLASGEFAKNLLFSVYAHIYLAAALQETGRNSDAAAALKIALDTALPDALYMPFAENYDLIGSLLAKASSKTRKDALAHIKALAGQLKTGRATLIEEMRARALLRGEDQATGDDDLKKFHAFNARYDLTEKEIEIFTYILRNLSVREMAERMDITRSGIEYHIANLFGKTGVNRQRHLRQLYATFSFADDIRRPYG
jgi:LuxR family maltose regulon positive regulatory protein